MNLEFLEKKILPLRAQEIKDGKNLSTTQPIYVVLDLMEQICSGWSDYLGYTNYKQIEKTFGYFDNSLDSEDREFSESEEGMTDPEEVTRFYTDRIVAFFLTSGNAHAYLEYQKHNLSNPYVYVFHSGYRNWEMDNLLNGQ